MLDASLEVRSAVVYASLIVILVFVPVFFLDGLSGSFFRPLAMAYVLAILASLLVALTVTPALSLMLLTGAVRAPARVAAGPGLEGDVSRDLAAAGAPARLGGRRSWWSRSPPRAGPSWAWARSSCPTSRKPTS